MKQYVFLSLLVIGILSCKNNGQNKDIGVLKKDTVLSKSIVTYPKKDSSLQNGESITRYNNGVIKMRGMMKDGKRIGVWKSWYDSGSQWSETTFADGKKNGRTTTWFSNEKKRYEGYYTNDKQSGKWTVWDETGKVIKSIDYDAK